MGEMFHNENWKKIRDYAVGKQDIDKYKKLVKAAGSKNFVSIDWVNRTIPNVVKRAMKAFRQSVKNYKMVSRLKSIQHL